MVYERLTGEDDIAPRRGGTDVGRAHDDSRAAPVERGAPLALALLTLLFVCVPDAPTVTVSRLRTEGCGLADEIATGFSVGSGVVITAVHPLEGDSPVLRDGKGELALTALDTRADVAVLQPGAPSGELPEFRAAGGRTVTVLLVRDGASHSARVTVRVLSHPSDSTTRSGTTVERDGLVLSIGIVGGDSGAPVIGRDGKVLGLMFANVRESEESYAIAV